MEYRYPAKTYDERGRHTGPGPWLALVHEANRITPGMFWEPESTGDWWAGGYVEEYAAARVLHREDESVSLFPKTDEGAATLAAAARVLG